MIFMRSKFLVSFLSLIVIALSTQAQSKRIMTFAGSGGTGGFSGDGWAATGATLFGPTAISADRFGNVYIVDYFNIRVRVVRPNGVIYTFAGNGDVGSYTDSTLASSTNIHPIGVAADRKGNVFISDNIAHVIYKVNKLGIITRYAGTANSPGYSGDGGSARNAKMNYPYGLAVDRWNNLYVAEAANHVIRKIDTFGRISTVAGIGTAGYTGDGDSATLAQLDSPYAVAVDKHGAILVVDYHNNVIRRVDDTGVISTFAGIGVFGYTGDGGPALGARFKYPAAVAVDTNGFVYISDAGSNTVRYVDTNNVIRTLAGNGTPGFGGDLGAPEGANLFNPNGLTIDSFGTLFIADANNQRVRKIFNATLSVAQVSQAIAIDIYPNPSLTDISISGLTDNSSIVSVLDIAGRLIANANCDGATQVQLNTETLTSGTYVIRVTDKLGNVQATKAFIKQ
jgi:hypothetical protein